jgi:bifunctional non-homologous end joining protein LigD
MVWDRGFWLPDGQGSAADALSEGELKFVLAGEKLKGGWVLVRMKRDRQGSGRTNWLLIKHRDEYARSGASELPDDDRSVASGRSMGQIAAGKGRKPRPFINAGGKLARPDAVWNSMPRKQARALRAAGRSERRSQTPGRQGGGHAAMPQFIAPQLCKAVARPSSGEGWGHEIKLDGYRLQLRIEHGNAELRTRKGLNWTDKFSAIAEAARSLPDGILDGEVVALRRDGVTDFSSLQAALAGGRTDDLVFLVFDLLFLDSEDMRLLPLIERKRVLRDLLEKHLPDGRRIRYVDHVQGDGNAVLESARQMGLEGIVSKRLAARYTSGRGEAWTKAKCRAGHEVVIGGWSGGPKLLRSLIAGVYRGSRLVHVGRVGTGFDAATSADLLARLKALETRKSPFSGEGAPRKERDVTWVKPQLVAEVTFGGWTDAGMVRQATFKGLREDKPAREVRAASPEEVGVAPLPTKPGTVSRRQSQMAAGQDTSVLGVAISNPDKVLWPPHGDEEAVTKIDLAHYLEAVGPWMIEHIKGRPCSIIRAPDGIGQQTFFQRHAMPGISKLVALVDVSGDRKPYLQIDSVEGLIAMGQIAALEFHPWNCALQRPEIPGRLVFDLDPAPDVAFGAVIDAAKELRERLQRLGLVAFCKTTGGKGLHVVVPLATSGKNVLGWKEAKAFTQAVVAAMASDSPDRYLTKMTKKLRKGRIFLDYLRNDRMATAVAPLSPRARPGAPVSMPVNWRQVRKGLEPMRYTIASAPEMLTRSGAWKEYAEAARPLAQAARRFLQS